MTQTISKEHLPLFEGMVNGSVLKEDELRLSGQCRIMFNRLKCGPATNIELQSLAKSMNTAGRISDTRIELKEHGWDIQRQDSRHLSAGVNLYAMIDGNGKIVNGV